MKNKSSSSGEKPYPDFFVCKETIWIKIRYCKSLSVEIYGTFLLWKVGTITDNIHLPNSLFVMHQSFL